MKVKSVAPNVYFSMIIYCCLSTDVDSLMDTTVSKTRVFSHSVGHAGISRSLPPECS